MIKFEKIDTPNFSDQLESKILYSQHNQDISIAYQSTYTLKYVLKGSKNYTFDNREIEVSKNEYLFINEGKNIHTEASKGTVGLSFFLSPELINDIYSNQYDSNHSPQEFLELSQIRSNDHISPWLQKLTYNFDESSLNSVHQIEDLLIKITELIIKEQTSIEKGFERLEVVKYNTQKELYKFIHLSKEYIDDNFHSEITLDSISQNVCVSKYYLHRLFTEITGITPIQYLTKVRLDKAKYKLQKSKHSISEIASECGFESAAYFSRAFKKHIGISPSKYRNPL